MQLVVTVDVEEDQWGFRHNRKVTTANVRQLLSLNTLFRQFNVVPTYFLTYPVVNDDGAVALLRHYYESGQCEIGMHCHAWTTPPFEEDLSRYNSMLCNLDPQLQAQKLRYLYHTIARRLRTRPIAYRAGRWGYCASTARILGELGCTIDSSMTPFTSWTRSYGPDYSSVTPRPYRYFPEEIFTEDASGPLIEIPASIGYLRGNFQACARLAERLSSPSFRRWRLQALLAHVGIVRKVWLSPEQESVPRLIRLISQMGRQGYQLLNLVFHSSSLLAGSNPFVRTPHQQEAFMNRLRKTLEFCRSAGITFGKLSSFEPRLRGPGEHLPQGQSAYTSLQPIGGSA